MFTPSRGSYKEEGEPEEPVMQPFALILKPFFVLLCFLVVVLMRHRLADGVVDLF